MVLATLLLAVISALALLGVAVATGPLADAWHPVVSVNGHMFDRTALRARMRLDRVLLAQREAALQTLQASGLITQADVERVRMITLAENADPLRTAIDGLVADRIIVDEAHARGIDFTTHVRTELERASTIDLAVHLRAVTIQLPIGHGSPSAGDWPTPAPEIADRDTTLAQLSAASQRASREMLAGRQPAEVAASLVGAGWRATAWDTWLPRYGPVEGLPDAFVGAARSNERGSLGAIVDEANAVGAVGVTFSDQAIPVPGDVDGLDGDTVNGWAEARAAEAALRATFEKAWSTEALSLVRVSELVIGPASNEGADGEYRALSHLVLSQLPDAINGEAAPAELAVSLASDLRALDVTARRARFAELVDLANTTPLTDPLARSGEMGYVARDSVLPALREAAFGARPQTGDVVGPVTTSVGPELFLVEGTFNGRLDDRSNAALGEARQTVDLETLARRIAPVGEWLRATGSLWRAEPETITTPESHRGFTETALGDLSDPFVLDGEIVVVKPLERVVAMADTTTLARLRVRGFQTWLFGQLSSPGIVRDPEPLPGVVVATPSAQADQSRGRAIPTPYLPALPTH